jgi:hypothetical protein
MLISRRTPDFSRAEAGSVSVLPGAGRGNKADPYQNLPTDKDHPETF